MCGAELALLSEKKRRRRRLFSTKDLLECWIAERGREERYLKLN